MKPGIYKLTATIGHPKTGYFGIDRRQTRDWRYAAQWLEGERFVVTLKRDLDAEHIMTRLGQPIPEGGVLVTRMYQYRGYSSDCVVLDKAGTEIFAALAAKFEPVGNETATWLTIEGVGDDTLRVIVGRLVDQKKIKLDDLKAEYNTYMSEEE